jgi:hypothetical protein
MLCPYEEWTECRVAPDDEETDGALAAAIARGIGARRWGRSQDFLAQAGEDQFNAQQRGRVVYVDYRIDFDQLEGNH